MTDPHILAALAAEYDPEDGSLGLLARGRFDGARLERLLDLLDGLDLGDAGLVDRRLVALLWPIPALLERHVGEAARRGGDAQRLRVEADLAQQAVTRILGSP